MSVLNCTPRGRGWTLVRLEACRSITAFFLETTTRNHVSTSCCDCLNEITSIRLFQTSIMYISINQLTHSSFIIHVLTISFKPFLHPNFIKIFVHPTGGLRSRRSRLLDADELTGGIVGQRGIHEGRDLIPLPQQHEEMLLERCEEFR